MSARSKARSRLYKTAIRYLIVKNRLCRLVLPKSTFRLYSYYLLALDHMDHRLAAIRSDFAAVDPGFVVFIGNSHAELLGAGQLEGFTVVNGGIGGTSARGYRTLIQDIHFTTRAKAAVVFVGSNDIIRSRKSRPLDQTQAAGFADAVTAIIAWLRQKADLILIAAVPPVTAGEIPMEALAVEAYSECLKDLCSRYDCKFFDPFSDMRDGPTGMACQGAVGPDGIHFKDYQNVLTRIIAELDAHHKIVSADGSLSVPTPVKEIA